MRKKWENGGERAGRIEGGRQQRPKVLCPTYQSARVSRQIRTSELCKQWIFGIAGIAYHFVLACACIPRARAQSTTVRANTIPENIIQEQKHTCNEGANKPRDLSIQGNTIRLSLLYACADVF